MESEAYSCHLEIRDEAKDPFRGFLYYAVKAFSTNVLGSRRSRQLFNIRA
jgi:hypothetical protein